MDHFAMVTPHEQLI